MPEHLGIETAVVVACFMGGSTAIDVALAAPQRVAWPVLVGAESPGFGGEGYEPPQWPELVAFKGGDMDRASELDAEIWVVGHGRTLADVDRHVFDLVVEMDFILLDRSQKGWAYGLSRPTPGRAHGSDLGSRSGRCGRARSPRHEGLRAIWAKSVVITRQSSSPYAAHLRSPERPDELNGS